jgi:energy-coupling factor transporter ATP-binding protein EcfA2
MAGADFLRADLHVHSFSDSELDPTPELQAYIEAAIASGLGVMAITDHNRVSFVRDAVRLADTQPLLVIPGIEISTHDGHLLALFSPDEIDALEELAAPSNLGLKDLSETEKRSNRSMLDLIEEIYRRGGLAIPAHVDAADGFHERMGQAELEELLSSPALAGLEFAKREPLSEWFTDEDPDEHRRAAWKARQRNDELRERGLARVMSSDAHSLDKVGLDRTSRTLTRLRLDDPNFSAIRNALLFNPKARCKAEAILPATYPRVLSARFAGGFLDGVELEFSPNLNCLIGGRGAGKSTALLALRAALGAKLGPDENADEADRMPDETEVRFVDAAGSERIAIRRRGEESVDAESGSPIRLRLADLGQEESGRLARGYEDDPSILLEFLDGFVVRHHYDEEEAQHLAGLADNASEVRRTAGTAKKIKDFEGEHARLDASLKAAQTGKLESIAQWAGLLAAQTPLLARLEEDLNDAARLGGEAEPIGIDELAEEFGVDLSRQPARDFVDGETGLRIGLQRFDERRRTVDAEARVALEKAAAPSLELVKAWQESQADMERRRRAKQEELEAQGLKVQAGAVQAMAERLNVVKNQLSELRRKKTEHQEALKQRDNLLNSLHANRERLFEARKATLKRIAQAANAYSDGPIVRVFFEQAGMDAPWVQWLTKTFGFKTPRVQRLAARIRPAEFADKWLRDRPALLALKDDGGDAFLSDDALRVGLTWDNLFELQTMELEDRPRIEVQEPGGERKPFDRLSTGQQRSVLLSLLLCAERNEPLVLDQPEDHLDAKYIATAVVRHLEAAKERRQVIIATHSANLTVLGDAELVIPMHVAERRGQPYEAGAVDRPATRDQVCALLEGGVEAYRKRGERYGFRFEACPSA